MAETIVIKVVNGPAGAEATFYSSFTIGRSKGVDFIVNSPMVSRQHARVNYELMGARS
jgi:pSer/pThr/pTyr-binding forkhead associated (FHA) protein